MSSYAAIAGVSSTLRNLIKDRLEQSVPITIAPPDINVSGVWGKRLNIYLYQITESPALRNQDFPKGGNPAAYGRPPLSLDLHYMLTAFGGTETAADADLQAQLILGDTMRALHEYPVVTSSMREGDLPANPLLLDASLVGAVENLRITLQAASLEEVSKLWSALPNSNFRRSVLYLVTVVQIESRRPRVAPLPVRAARPAVRASEGPIIESVSRVPPFTGLPPDAAEIGDKIVLKGQNLAAEVTKIRIGQTLLDATVVSDTELTVIIPATVAAGITPVSVVHGPPLSPSVVESEPAALRLLPKFVSVSPGSAAAGATVTVTVNPAVRATQDKKLILGDRVLDANFVSPDAAPSTTVSFKLPSGVSAIPPGTKLLRVRIDGAESRLTIAVDTNQYNGPTLVVT